MKELGLLFGNTAQAAATTLAAFFMGLVVGARYWGRKAALVTKPLRTYALLEAGVAASALLYFLLMDGYRAMYPSLFQALGTHPSALLVMKFVLGTTLLFPASFFMGGTLPMMGQHLIRKPGALGSMGSLLYGTNTLGAVLGALAAGFYLPRRFGLTNAYFVAVAITTGVALLAFRLGRQAPRGTSSAATESGRRNRGRVQSVLSSPRAVETLAFFSGFAALSLQVLWTRMFAQVLQNSVYTFSIVLVTFLASLVLGACLAHCLIRSHFEPPGVLLVLLATSAVLVAATPFVFYWLTSGIGYFGGERDFGSYVVGAFGTVAFVMLLPGIAVGTMFPYLLRLAEPFVRNVGRTMGDLTAANMVGAVVGALIAGFVLLDVFGLWGGIRLVAAAYFAVGLVVMSGQKIESRTIRLLPAGGVLLLTSILDPSNLPVVKVDPLERGESLLQVWEGSSGIVSVVRDKTSLTMKLDNDYSLGGTGAALSEERQAHLPLLVHPNPKSVFFLGMGTGITAGAALQHRVERLVVSELEANIVEASRTFFRPYVHGLFDDERVTIVADDGRNYLFGGADTFDVIVSDLFMPWKAGVSNLYTREHYLTARARLRQRGIYVQWLPLYQMSQKEFGVIARTMLDVFPQVTLWRGTMAPAWETVALLGYRDATALDPGALRRRLQGLGELGMGERLAENSNAETSRLQRTGIPDLLLHYCGNLTAATRLFDEYPVNTDDRPVIEYEAPITHREGRAGSTPWFVGQPLAALLTELLKESPPETDPYLERLSAEDRRSVRAGLALYMARFLDEAGDPRAAWKAMEEFQRLYAADEERGTNVSEAEQSRQELEQLIETYEERIRALREHLRQVGRASSETDSKNE